MLLHKIVVSLLRSGVLMRFFLWVAGTFVAAWIVMIIQRGVGAPSWASYAIAAGLAVLLNVAFNLSRRRYISGFADWELIAGRAVVPGWIDGINLAAICFGLAIPFQLLALLAR